MLHSRMTGIQSALRWPQLKREASAKFIVDKMLPAFRDQGHWSLCFVSCIRKSLIIIMLSMRRSAVRPYIFCLPIRN